MASRSGILAGKTVIVVQVQESIDKALGTISSKLNKFSAQVNRIGLELFGGGLVGSIVTASTLKQFKEFEDRILFLSTKLIATQADFALVESKIRELGRTTSFTALEVADAATVLAQAGLSAKELVNTLQPTLDLARGAQIELSQAGAILTNTIRSYGLETTKANVVASQFVTAARLGTLNVLDLKESIKEVLGTVRNLNIDLPTTLALITQLAERSLKGTKAGTSLNTALLNLASKTDVIKKQLGIVVPDNLDGDAFINFLEQLYDRINRLGNLRRTAVLQQLFNIRGGRAITALDDIPKIIRLRKEIASADDAARKASETMDSGFGGSIRRALSAVESLSIKLGEITEKVLAPFNNAIPSVVNGLEKFAIANETLVATLVLTPPALVLLGASLLTLSFVGGKVAGVVGLLAGTFRSLSGVGLKVLNTNLVAATKGYRALFGTIRREGKGANLKDKGGLFQRLDEGLSAALLTPQRVGGRGRNAKDIRPTSFFKRVGSAEIKSADVLRKAYIGLLAPIKAASRGLGSFLNFIRGISKGLGRGVLTFFRNLPKLFDLTVTGLFKVIKGFAAFGRGLLTALNGVRRFVFSFSGILTIIELLILFGPKITFIREAFERLGKGLGNAFDTIRNTGKDLAPVFKLFQTGFGAILDGNGKLGIDGIIQGVKQLVTIVKSNLVIAFNQVVEAISPLYDFLRQVFQSLIEIFKLIGGIAGATFDSVTTGVGALGGEANKDGGFFSQIKQIFQETFSTENMKLLFAGIGGFFIDIAKSLLNVFEKIFVTVNNTMTFIQGAVTSIFNLINKGLTNAVSSLSTSGFSGIVRKVLLGFLPGVEGAERAAAERQAANEAASDKIVEGFQGGINKLDNSLQGFLNGLNDIFAVDTEARSKDAIDAAKLEKEKAQSEAEALANNIAKGVNPLINFGKSVSDLFNRGIINDKPILGLLGGLGGLIPGKAETKPLDFNALLEFAKGAAATGMANLEPKKIIDSKIQQLRLEQRAARNNLTDVNRNQLVDVFSSPNLSKFISGIVDLEGGIKERTAVVRAENIARQNRIDELKAEAVAQPVGPSASLKDIVSATVGTFRQTRGNLLKVAGAQSIEQKQLSALEQIQTNTGGSTTALGDLLNKSVPFVFQ
jgi:TP901 family phage tail tape measure protein